VTGAFDDVRSPEARFLHEASRLGELHVALWSDEVVRAVTGRPPKFPAEERKYLLEAFRYVGTVGMMARRMEAGEVPAVDGRAPDVWAVREGSETAQAQAACAKRGMAYEVIGARDLAGFPEPEAWPEAGKRPSLVVTGCYDWLHSGHIRFFEEVSGLGELIVVLGHDANVLKLKGEGHPLYPQAERRYMVASVRHVSRALVSTGWGWLDAEPEIDLMKPDMYAVNEDGDKPEKRAFCESRGIRYVVLKRTPREGLPRRSSTDLRGF